MHYALVEGILMLSVSDTWDKAKLEWDFEYAYENSYQTCLCTHYPIKNICVIRNKHNGNETEVGNCCINKFLGIDDGNKIFISIKRLKKDITKSMNVEVVEYLKNKRVLNDFEFDFYLDIHRKRSLSKKQIELKKSINIKFLKYATGESGMQFARINMVLEWAKNHPRFDLTFINSLKSVLEHTGKLTERQKTALENVIRKCKIEQEV